MINMLFLGDQLFAQDVSCAGRDTAALRRVAPGYGAAMEWGTVDGVRHTWLTIPLAKQYLNPVVVARPVSTRGGDPGVIRLRNVSHNSFDLMYDEWKYRDGYHTQERVFYLVAEAGSQVIAGLTVESGTLESSKLLLDGWNDAVFSSFFGAPPMVFTSVQTCNGWDPVTTRVRNCTALGFELTMDEEEAIRDGGHVQETLGWIAVQEGSGQPDNKRSLVVLSGSVNHVATETEFGQTLSRRFPVVISDMVSTYGSDPCFLRYTALTPSSITLFIQEEASYDAEMNHVLEDISLFVSE
jgi:hypothetical protein